MLFSIRYHEVTNFPSIEMLFFLEKITHTVKATMEIFPFEKKSSDSPLNIQRAFK